MAVTIETYGLPITQKKIFQITGLEPKTVRKQKKELIQRKLSGQV